MSGEAPAADDVGGTAACATWQRTSLMVAARHGQVDVVERFLETSCSQPQLDVVDQNGDTALIIAAREGHLDVVKKLLSAGADTAPKNLAGKTALESAKTEDIRKAIEAGEAKMEALLQAILAGAAPSRSAAGASSSAAGGLEALLGGLKLDAGAGMRGECPF
mmetsp:Transcript_95969/g.277142  ORF Transcript_95969/g.277142 Transcript_95969/m.277142 type:complete len:163 (+) Transcript_95969:48-536(+)